MTLYIGLFNGDKELKGGGYQRVEIPENCWHFHPWDFEISHVIEFPRATGSWGLVTHFALFDSKDQKSEPHFYTKYRIGIIVDKDNTVSILPGYLKIHLSE